MNDKNRRWLFALICGVAASGLAEFTYAQAMATQPTVSDTGASVPSAADSSLAEIIVTAEKRAERLSDVPMSITAATGDQLKTLGVTNPDQLEKLVPGFTIDKTLYGLPVYFIRGIGFNDTALGVSPAVSVYTDQLPIPFSPMARGATLDLERVEVLKGPQGTLFGENSTGGAINFIAAKPTKELKAGFDLTYGRFNEVDAEAFVSGPLTDTLSARLAVRDEYRGDWQKGYVINETLGAKNFQNARLIVDWEPTSLVKAELMATGWKDRSQAQQPQFDKFDPQATGPGSHPILYPIQTFPASPDNDRAAAWDPNRNFDENNWFYQVGGRLDVQLNDQISLTSLTSYSSFGQHVVTDFDATNYPISANEQDGNIDSFSQELRLSGRAFNDVLKWMIGGSYQKDRVFEHLLTDPDGVSSTKLGPFAIESLYVNNLQNIDTKALFGSLDYMLTDTLTAQVSVRYTKQDREFRGCAYDTGDGTAAAAFGFLSTVLSGAPQTIAPGSCFTLGSTLVPVPITTGNLNQHNIPWRGSLNWKANADTLFYANVTQGFKAGSFTTIPYIQVAEAAAVTQEQVRAYEIGSKLSLLSRTLELDGALFDYDYKNKQLDSFVNIPPFGATPGLVTIPKATVRGAEISATTRPYEGLTLMANATYVHTRIDENPVDPVNFLGAPGNFVGLPFNNTPKFQAVADVQYRFPVSAKLDAYFGSSVTYHSLTTGVLASGNPVSDGLVKIPSYALLDLRAGAATHDGAWRLEAWGRNVTDKFYLIGNQRFADYYTRYTGMPATYGVSVFYRN